MSVDAAGGAAGLLVFGAMAAQPLRACALRAKGKRASDAPQPIVLFDDEEDDDGLEDWMAMSNSEDNQVPWHAIGVRATPLPQQGCSELVRQGDGDWDSLDAFEEVRTHACLGAYIGGGRPAAAAAAGLL